MSEHPLDLSSRLIDTGVVDTPPNRITQEISQLADGVMLIESFSHVVVVDTGDGVVTFDTSAAASAPPWSSRSVPGVTRRCTRSSTPTGISTMSEEPLPAADAEAHARPLPRAIGHDNVNPASIATRTPPGTTRHHQSAPVRRGAQGHLTGWPQRGDSRHGARCAPTPPTASNSPNDPAVSTSPSITASRDRRSHLDLDPAAPHDRGRRPIHLELSQLRQPQKVQRHPLEWAQSLRAMAAMDPELFVPAHGLPIAGRDRIVSCLDTVAQTLETLVAEVVDAMNSGAVLDEIVDSVSVPAATLELPYLRPLYDEPEFVIRNIWRLYGGWWDGNPARLKPASDAAIGREVAALAGGVDALIERASQLSEAGDHRLACQLIEFAAAAEPESHTVHSARSVIYSARRATESSLMSKRHLP
ncbi:MAG: alkyl sulfatase dimerization domain-containing protein [Acidimicrobiales bacterium]